MNTPIHHVCQIEAAWWNYHIFTSGQGIVYHITHKDAYGL